MQLKQKEHVHPCVTLGGSQGALAYVPFRLGSLEGDINVHYPYLQKLLWWTLISVLI